MNEANKAVLVANGGAIVALMAYLTALTQSALKMHVVYAIAIFSVGITLGIGSLFMRYMTSLVDQKRSPHFKAWQRASWLTFFSAWAMFPIGALYLVAAHLQFLSSTD